MSASSGTVSIRFDVQGNEKLLQSLITTATGMDKVKSSATSLQSTLGGISVGNLGPLNNIATSVNSAGTAMDTAGTKVSSFKAKLAGIGSQLGQNATSFGVATASIWGVYNAYDSLEKVQIRAHAAAVRVSTLETTLASLIERRRIAMEKGNLTAEQMSILNEKITNTQTKLSVAQERNADIAQDLQEAWAGFISTVGPQAIAATGALVQLGTVFKSTFAGGGGFINTFKSAITSIFPSLAAAKAQSLLLGSGIGNLGGAMTNVAVGPLSKLKLALGDMGSAITSSKGSLIGMGGALAATGGFLVALAVDSINTSNKVRELQTALVGLETGSSAAFTNMAQQAKTFNQSLVGQIGGALADSNKTIFGTTPVIGFNMREVFKKRLDEDTNLIKADIAKTLEDIMTGSTATLAAQISPSTKANIDAGIKRIKEYLIDASGKNFATPDSSINTFDIIGKGPAANLQKIVEGFGKMVAGGNVDVSGLMVKQTAQVKTFAQAIVKDLGGAASAASVPTGILNNNIDLLIQSMIDGKEVPPELANAIKSATTEIINSVKNMDVLKTTISTLTGETAKYRSSLIILPPAYKGLTGETAKYVQTLDEAANKTQDFSGVISSQSKEVSDNAAKYTELKEGLSLYMDTTNASTSELENWTKINDATIKSIEGQRAALADNESYWKKLSETQFQAALANNKWIIEHTKVTKILDGSRESILAFSNAQKEGVTAAQDWFTSMVTGTVKAQTMTVAIAESAKAVGIHADMMSFSAGKAQELIASTYEMNTGFEKQAIAAAYSVKWLTDKKIIDTQLTAGTLEGAQAANDWTVSMIKSVEATQTEHDQLVALATEMTGLTNISHLTTEELQALMTGMRETGSAASAMAAMVEGRLTTSLSNLSSVLDAKDWKSFKDAFKDLEFGDLGGKLEGHFKEFDNMIRKINEDAREMGNIFDNMNVMESLGKLSGSDFKQGMKDLAQEVKDISKLQDIDTSDIQQFLKDLGATKDPKMLEKYGGIITMIEEKAKGGYTSKELDDIRKAIDATKADNLKAIADQLDAISKKATAARNPLGAILNPTPPKGGTTGEKFGETTPADAKKLFQDKWNREHPTTVDIPPPKPIVFPPPDMHNIIDAIKKIEVDIGSMVDFAANLVLALPPMNIDAINTGITTAEENLGSLIDFGANLVVAFPPPNIEALNGGLVTAEENLGSIIPFVAGLVTAFPAPDIVAVVNQTSAAKKAAATLVPEIASLKPVFPPVNIVAVVNQTSAAKKAAATLVPDIKSLKPAFPGVNIQAVVNSTSSAKKAASTLEGHVASLKLKFPKIDISNIESSVNQAQSKINSLKGTTVTNHVKTVFDNAGGNILNDMKIMSAATGKLFTTNGEQLFRVGDNPGGRETIAMIPHDKPQPIMERLLRMFPTVQSTIHKKLIPQSLASVEGGGRGSRSSSPTVVNVTTDVYLFPGSAQFKKYVKSIVLEGLSGMPVA